MSLSGMLWLFVSNWTPAWPVLAVLLAAAAAYLAAARGAAGWPARRSLAWLAGLATIALALNSGLAAEDETLLSVHMVQHTLLLLVAPLLLLLGQPSALALRVLRGARRRWLAVRLRRAGEIATPVVSLGAFTTVVIITHVPAVYSAALHDPLLHEAEHVVLVLAGSLLWWPVVGADPVPAHRLGGLGRLVYLLASMPPMALVGAYLDRQPTLVYPAYGAPARALGISALADQAQAGAVMWVLGSLIVTAVGLWAVMAALVGEERRMAAREARLISDGGGGGA